MCRLLRSSCKVNLLKKLVLIRRPLLAINNATLLSVVFQKTVPHGVWGQQVSVTCYGQEQPSVKSVRDLKLVSACYLDMVIKNH